jgi:hypothetical protein
MCEDERNLMKFVHSDASDEPKCKQGETYEKDCNTCHCTDAGVEVCTERACYNGPQFPDTAVEDHTEIPETNGQVCTPNETKMQVSWRREKSQKPRMISKKLVIIA